jgi:hypothetical protein
VMARCPGSWRPGDMGALVCDGCGFTHFGSLAPAHDPIDLPLWMKRKVLASIQAPTEPPPGLTSEKLGEIVADAKGGLLEHAAECDCDDCIAQRAWDSELARD